MPGGSGNIGGSYDDMKVASSWRKTTKNEDHDSKSKGTTTKSKETSSKPGKTLNFSGLWKLIYISRGYKA